MSQSDLVLNDRGEAKTFCRIPCCRFAVWVRPEIVMGILRSTIPHHQRPYCAEHEAVQIKGWRRAK